jgi:glutaredoxin-dependent peroxiredoxin
LGQLAPTVRSLGGEIVAVAVTATFSQQRFAGDLDIDFPLLSDWGGEVAAAYGVRYDSWKDHAGVAKRSTFVIDAGGVIRYSWTTDDALEMPDHDAAVAALRGLSAGSVVE